MTPCDRRINLAPSHERSVEKKEGIVKKRISIFIGFLLGCGAVYGADVSVLLDSTNGASGFVVADARTNERVRVTSLGETTINNALNVYFDVEGIMGIRGSVSIGGGQDVQVGSLANGYWNGVGIGYLANGSIRGAAVGHQANGADYGAAFGYSAAGTNYGAAMGESADACHDGAAVG